MIQKTISSHDTYSTEEAASLMAVGVDLIQEDPIRRIFDKDRPANPVVSHGLKRGGRVQYRFKEKSDEFQTDTLALSRTYVNAETFPSSFDDTLSRLKEVTKGTEAGQLVDLLINELPHEALRYIRAAFLHRNLLIEELATNKKLTELVLIKKADGNIILHHANAPEDVVKALLKN